MEIALQLRTIHPNPGPGKHSKTEEGKKARMERKMERRKQKKEQKKEAQRQKDEKFVNIVTWNVQGMSLGTNNKRKLKAVAAYTKKNKWDAVLLSEVRAEDKGTVWLGEDEDLTAVVYTEKAAILLRGHLLKSWCDEGQRCKFDKRTISVKCKGLLLISTYMPVYRGNNAAEIEQERDILRLHKQEVKSDEILIIGGDFNAHIGGGEERPGVCGKFGLRSSNNQGSDLLEWCQENNLCQVNSFYNHKRRGTWFSLPLQRWYELDGFIMTNDHRHKFARKVSTIGEATLSDHKPKKLKLEMKVEKKRYKNKPKKRPKIIWEKLRDPETARIYREKVQEIIENRDNGDNNDQNNENTVTNWDEIAEIVTTAAKEVCGVQEKEIENPWMIGRDVQIQEMRTRINAALTLRNDLIVRRGEGEEDLEDQIENVKTELKEARKHLKRTTARWEKEWWDEIIEDCREAGEANDTGRVYRNLKKLGTRGMKKASQDTNITKEEFKEHFKSISSQRFENAIEEIDEVLDQVQDISNTDEAIQWNDELNNVPTDEELTEQIKLMRESAPGEDNVRLIYLIKAGPEMIKKLYDLVRFMFNNDTDLWDHSLRVGLVIPLFKKGNRDVPGNYRGVVLLAMASRILARILANRLRVWAEKLKLMDDNQAGFRKHRSTCDVTQMMYRLQEDVEDWEKRVTAAGETFDEEDRPTARLLDLRKAYPRVNKYALWRILEKYGLGGRCLQTLKNLHETTTYKVKSREGESSSWTTERGLREGCPSSPILFNVYHQVSMRVAAKARKRKAEEQDQETGVTFNYVPGSYFPSSSTWEKYNSETKKMKLDDALFADDTTLVGKRREIDAGVEETKKIMNKLEERNNDDKEETLLFGKQESEDIRMLGCYMGWDYDVKQRIKRGNMAWIKIRNRLKGSKLSKRRQARIVETCVESTILFDCQARTWRKTEIKKLQQTMDKKYRSVWARGNMPPLMQMQQDGKNMQDVRNALGIKSLRYKIEKRCLERIGHVMRQEDTRMVKAATLGWLEELERWPKVPGKKRKTLLYWKGLLREAEIDYTRIGKLTEDRKQWKQTVRERMKHVEEWEKEVEKKHCKKEETGDHQHQKFLP